MIKWKVEIEGLPPFFMEGKSAAAVRMQIRKLLRSPDMLLNVSRITEVDFKKMLRARLAGKDTESKEDDVKQEVDEDAPATAMGGGGIAGGGIDLPDQPGSGEPGVHPKKKRKQVLIDRKHDRRTKEFKLYTIICLCVESHTSTRVLKKNTTRCFTLSITFRAAGAMKR